MPARAPRLRPWRLAAPFGIELKDQAWNTGSVWAVSALSHDRLLLGTEQGGLWLSEPDASGVYQSRCVSEAWDQWWFSSSVQDPAHSSRVFFGTFPGLHGSAGVYIGDFATQPESWTFVPLPPSILAGGSVNPSVGGVVSMIILPLQRLLVVATGYGVGWIQIDSQPFIWNTAPEPITDLANLQGDDFLFVAIADSPKSASAPPPIPTLNSGSISGSTGFTSTPIPHTAIRWTKRPGHPHQNPIVSPLRIASCRNKPENAYCLGKIKTSDTPRLFIIRSRDAGKTWLECAYVTSRSSEDLGRVLEFEKMEDPSGPKSSTAIAVHPVNPEILAAGYAGAALSTDGGNRWMTLTQLEGWHSDIHRLWFHLEPPARTPKGSPPRPRRYSLYIPSDGGILRWTGADNNSSLAAIPTRADSSRNRTLPIVMLYAPDKAFTAAFGNIAVAGSVIAAGSQDNANLWFDVGDPVWRRASSSRGDGGAVALSNAGNNSTILTSQSTNNVPVGAAHRVNSSAWGNSTTVPVRLSPTALDGTGILPAFLRPMTPGIGLAAGAGSSTVIALASVQRSNLVYAAIIRTLLDPAGSLISQEVEWILFGGLPTGEIVSCLEAHDDTSVLVGTESGKVFLLKESLVPSEVSFNHKPGHPIRGIASNGKTIACFAKPEFSNAPQSTLYVGHFRDRTVPPTTKRWFDLHRVETSAFARNDGSAAFHSICANRSQRNTTLSFALTVDENEVWVCLSDLSRWRKAVAGLPHAIRCSDVVFSDSLNGGELLLSSYGRAVWRLRF